MVHLPALIGRRAAASAQLTEAEIKFHKAAQEATVAACELGESARQFKAAVSRHEELADGILSLMNRLLSEGEDRDNQ